MDLLDDPVGRPGQDLVAETAIVASEHSAARGAPAALSVASPSVTRRSAARHWVHPFRYDDAAVTVFAGLRRQQSHQ
jgi:hypothetical protein